MSFPSNPAIGDQHTAYGDTYTWNGSVWTAGGISVKRDGRLIFIDEVAPAAAAENHIWYRMDMSSIAKRRSSAWENIVNTVSIGSGVSNSAPSTPTSNTAPSSNTAPTTSPWIEIGMTDNTNEQNSMAAYVTFVAKDGAADGIYNYTITGVSNTDIDVPLTGQINIVGGNANMTITALEDLTTEGQETLTLTIDETGDSASMIINDTSVAPPAPMFTVTPSNSGTTETRTITFTVTPSGPEAIGTNVTWAWTVIESADIDAAGSTYGDAVSGVTPITSADPFDIVFKFLSDGVIEGSGAGETGYFNVMETSDSFAIFVRDR